MSHEILSDSISPISSYEARKALITIPDAQLMEWGRKESRSFPDPTEHFLASSFFGAKDVLDEHLKGKRLISLGCGKGGLSRGLSFMSPTEGAYEHDFGPKEFVAVDLFVDEGQMRANLESDLRRTESINEEIKESLRSRLRFEREDILTYLLKQQDASGNILISSVNFSLIPSQDYLSRVAQEAYRVLPENGVFALTDCAEIASEAKKIFPHCTEDIALRTKYFSKEELCPREVFETHSFALYQCLLEGSRNGVIEVDQRFKDALVNPDKERGGQIVNDLETYITQVGFVLDYDELIKAFFDGGSVAIARKESREEEKT